MSTEENKAISQRIGEAIGAHDFATMRELMAPNVYEEFVRTLNMTYAAFPDYHGTNNDTIAEGDKVVTRWTYYGTHKGPLMGFPPTGKQVTFKGISIDQYADGKLINSWIEVDRLDVVQQLGIIPALLGVVLFAGLAGGFGLTFLVRKVLQS